MSSRSAAAERPPIELRSPKWWFNGLWRVGVAALIIYLPLAWFGANYRLAYDMIEGVDCLPYTLFLIDLNDQDVGRGDYVAFKTMEMEPFYANGTTAVKILAGVPGDRVRVDADGVVVNGEYWGPMHHLREGGKLTEMGKTIADYERDERVPEGRFWMMATHERSYDARYWGTIAQEQLVGRVIPIF